MEKIEDKGIITRIYDWFKNLTIKSLLTGILLTFIIIVILMSVSFIPGIISRVSSSLSAALYSVFVPAEDATMTADKKIVSSGEDFTISFKRGDTAIDGLFTISYSCDNNATFLSVESNGLKKVDCDTKYYLLENETAITLRPSTNEEVVRLNIEGAFENNTTQKLETVGAVRMTIKNESVSPVVVPVTPPKATTTPIINNPVVVNPPFVPSQPAPVQPVYYGKPDLATRILQVGLLANNNSTMLISNQTQFNYSDMVGVKFEVRNDGDANTGSWYFTASLPSASTPNYTSPIQRSLRPGDSIIFTLGFGSLKNQSNSLITINVDPQNTVYEGVEYNNIVTQAITNIGYKNNYYYNNNYNYNNYNNGYYDVYGNWINYNNNNYYYNNNDLTVSCYAEPDDPETGDRVRWYAEADGGDGDYNYEWTGTNSLDSSSQNPSKTYSSRGWKYATVTVTDSDDYEVSQTCSVYVD